MTGTIFEVQATFPCVESREDAMASLMASGYDQAGFGLLWHDPTCSAGWPELDAPVRSGDGEGGPAGALFVLTMRARNEIELTRLAAKMRKSGALKALAVMRLE